MSVMVHRGIYGSVDVSEEDGCLVGHLLGVPGIVGFHGGTVEEARAAFEEAVDDWIDWREDGEPKTMPVRFVLFMATPPHEGWRWRLEKGSGEILAVSPTAYLHRSEAEEAVDLMRTLPAIAEISGA